MEDIQTYTATRQTELGELPAEWEVVNIEKIVDFERGTEPGSKYYNDKGKGIRFLRVSDISGNRCDFIFTESENVKLCNENDILITFDGSPGIVKRGFSGAYSSGIRKVKILDENSDLNFIFYVLQTNYVQDVIKKHSIGVTIKHASKAIPHILIPLPPLSEQKKIAYVLSTAQEAIEKTQKTIDALKELKKSMMKHLFTYGPVSLQDTDKIELKDTEIGEIPKEWEVVKLGEKNLFSFSNGLWIGKKEPLIKVFVIRNTDFQSNGKLSFENVAELLVEKQKFIERKLKKGDIIIERSGGGPKQPVGRVAYFDKEIGDYTFSNFTSRLRIVDISKCYDKYLLYILYYVYISGHTIKLQHGSTGIRNLDFTRYKNLPIPLPPLPVQERIASILSTIDEAIEAKEKKKKALEDTFKSLLKNLMTGKIRVHNLKISGVNL